MLRSLKRVFVLLDAFTAEEPEWSLGELSRRVKMAKPTVHHIMASLIEGGWIDRHPQTRKYRLGVRLWEKGCLAIHQIGVREVARPVMEQLVQVCGETVRLGVLDAADPQWVIYVDRVEGAHAVRADMSGGIRAPSYCVATGKALLAYNPDALQRLLEQPLKRYTPATLASAAALSRDLERTRERGYSVNGSEFRADVVGIAAPVRNHEGHAVAAVGVSGPAYRLGPAVLRRLAPTIAAAALNISQRMGYAPRGGGHENVQARRSGNGPLRAGTGRGRARVSDQADRGAGGLRSRGRQ